MPREEKIPKTNQSEWFRRFLPHYNHARNYQMITYHLADSLPKSVLQQYQVQDDSIKLRKSIEAYLDAGHGSCLLQRQEVAEIIIESWRNFHLQRYELIAYVVMPTHVHLLIKTYEGFPLDKVLHSWKSYTAHQILKIYPEAEHHGHFWQREYWDRYIRDEKHFVQAIDYIHNNPVKAGLCSKPEDWPWSSAT